MEKAEKGMSPREQKCDQLKLRKDADQEAKTHSA